MKLDWQFKVFSSFLPIKLLKSTVFCYDWFKFVSLRLLVADPFGYEEAEISKFEPITQQRGIFRLHDWITTGCALKRRRLHFLNCGINVGTEEAENTRISSTNGLKRRLNRLRRRKSFMGHF